MKAKEFIPAAKPRNFVAKNAMKTTSGAGAHRDKKKEQKQGYEKHKGKGVAEQQVSELSTDLLGRYKKAASADATAADKRGDYKHGDKRFSGIVKATKKQFANDAKKK